MLTPLARQFYPQATWPEDLQAVADQVYANLDAPDALTEGQFAALTSLVQSITLPVFIGSTLQRLVNGGNFAFSTYEFEKFVYVQADGKVVVDPALVRRRQQEKAIWLHP
jgi:GH24 family phage-related lysozyme (muramidase)